MRVKTNYFNLFSDHKTLKPEVVNTFRLSSFVKRQSFATTSNSYQTRSENDNKYQLHIDEL